MVKGRNLPTVLMPGWAAGVVETLQDPENVQKTRVSSMGLSVLADHRRC
ncbi:MAG TPA: hypothetical protein PK110_15950 [Niabella sp.]|nr:hypothetical protein [Niabella sp.]